MSAETGPRVCKLERLVGIEPTTPAWKAEVLPLNYSRNFFGAACPSAAGVQAFVHDSSRQAKKLQPIQPS